MTIGPTLGRIYTHFSYLSPCLAIQLIYDPTLNLHKGISDHIILPPTGRLVNKLTHVKLNLLGTYKVVAVKGQLKLLTTYGNLNLSKITQLTVNL